MTMPNERFRSVIQTRDFLISLLDPKKTPKVPKDIRENAYYLLKHFPHEYEMEMASEKLPDLFQKIG